MTFCFNIETSGCSDPKKVTVVGHRRDSLYTCRPRPFTGSTSIGGPKELIPGAFAEQKSSKLGLAQASCSLRSVYLTFLRPAGIYCLVLRISWVSRKHTMPPKPADSQKYTVPPSFIPVNWRSLYKFVPEYLWAVIVYVHFHFSRHFLTLKIRNVRSTTVRSEFWESVFFSQTIVGRAPRSRSLSRTN